MLLLGRKIISNLDSILKYRDITLLTRVQTMVFPVVMDGCESWTIKKLEHWRTEPTRLLHPWNFPGKSSGVGYHFLLQGIFLNQGSTLGLPHCRQTFYHLRHHEEKKKKRERERTRCTICRKRSIFFERRLNWWTKAWTGYLVSDLLLCFEIAWQSSS